MPPIELLGTLKGVTIKSKATQDNDIVHVIDLKLEVIDGKRNFQDVLERIKEIVQITIDPRQPALFGSSKQYKDEETEAAA